MKDNGKIIISFPICTDIKTFEDDSITTPEGRLKAFGQTDHVRLYGFDFRERLENFGLDVKTFSLYEEFTEQEIKKFGFIKDDVIIICSVKK